MRKNKNIDKQTGRICDIKTGQCTANEEIAIQHISIDPTKKARIIYYTDPICSHCWGLEPILKKLQIEYGEHFDIEYKMGGLLESWNNFNDSANSISEPQQVAPHWDEVGQITGMSIDGDIWFEDPIQSSYPPSIAFKAVQLQNPQKALQFLRRIREMVFLEKKNICKEDYLVQAAQQCDINVDRFKKDYHAPSTKNLFLQERNEGRQLGVHGFPSMIFVSDRNGGILLSGRRRYETYVSALSDSLDEIPAKQPCELTEIDLLKRYGYLATVEIAMALDQVDKEIERNLKKLVKGGLIKNYPQKSGDFWRFVEA